MPILNKVPISDPSAGCYDVIKESTPDTGVTVDGLLIKDGRVQRSASLVNVTDATTYTVLAANSGLVHILPNFKANCAITLPAVAAGLKYEFIYGGAAADAHDVTMTAAATANLFKGGLVHIDSDAGDAGDEAVTVFADASDDDALTLNNLEAGTYIKLWSDGTYWYITGTVVSDTAPAFA